MKKIPHIFLALICIFSLCACKNPFPDEASKYTVVNRLFESLLIIEVNFDHMAEEEDLKLWQDKPLQFSAELFDESQNSIAEAEDYIKNTSCEIIEENESSPNSRCLVTILIDSSAENSNDKIAFLRLRVFPNSENYMSPLIPVISTSINYLARLSALITNNPILASLLDIELFPENVEEYTITQEKNRDGKIDYHLTVRTQVDFSIGRMRALMNDMRAKLYQSQRGELEEVSEIDADCWQRVNEPENDDAPLFFDISCNFSSTVNADAILLQTAPDEEGSRFSSPKIEIERLAAENEDESDNNNSNNFGAGSAAQNLDDDTDDNSSADLPILSNRSNLNDSNEPACNLFSGQGCDDNKLNKFSGISSNSSCSLAPSSASNSAVGFVFLTLLALISFRKFHLDKLTAQASHAKFHQ